MEYKIDDRLPAVADIYPRAISIGVLSKAFALPALRVGWIACQQTSIVKRAMEIKAHFSICNSLIDEKITTRVIQHHEAIWDRSRTLIADNLDLLEKLIQDKQQPFKYTPPKAGCCCFMLMDEKTHAEAYATQLIEKHKLLVLPNPLFLTSINGFRLGFGYQKNTQYLNTLSTP